MVHRRLQLAYALVALGVAALAACGGGSSTPAAS